MQSKNGATCTLFWENLNALMVENGAGNVNFKGFLADNA